MLTSLPGAASPMKPARRAARAPHDITGIAIPVIAPTPGEAAISGLPADGSHVACRLTPSPPPAGWTLTATGPGGTDQATAP